MKKSVVVVVTGLLLFSIASRAAVNVGGATGGTNISADNSATATNWTSLGAITVGEPGNGKGDIAAGTGVTLVLKTPAGFEFNTARTNVTFQSGRDISFARGTYSDSTTLTVTLNVGGTGGADTLTIGGTGNNALQVRPTAGTPLSTRHIYRPSTGGGTATITGITTEADGTGSGSNFGNLSEVAGNATKLTFSQSPAGAQVGTAFATQPIIRTLDQFNNNTSAGLPATQTVTVNLASGTGPLLGTTSFNIGTAGGNGVINPTDLRIDVVGTDKQLSATTTNLADATSSVFTVDKGNQTITFPAIGNHTYGDSSFIVSATASSGLSVSFAIVSGPATILGDTVTITGAGTVTIEATQAGDSNWNAATNSQSFSVAKAMPVITWNNPADITYGTALDDTQLNATASVAGNFLYSPASGVILNGGTNQLSVSFTPTDSSNYSNATATVSIVVNKADQTITFGTLPNKLTTDAPFTLNATASSGLTLSYSIVSGPASVSGNTVTLSGATGTVTLSASQSGNANYNAATNVDQSFDVTSGAPTISWNTPADIEYGTALSTNQLNATAGVPGTFVYSPDFGTVLPVGSNQVLSVTFTPTDTNSYSSTSTNVLINVVKATPSITWPTPSAIVFGTALTTNQLNATTTISGTFTYVPDFGTVLNAGTNQLLSVSFVPDDTTNYNNANASVFIDVSKAVPTVTWATPADINYGTSLTTNELNATASVSGTFAYSPDVGTVLNAGSGQTLSVTFTPDAGSNYVTVNTNVSINVAKAPTTITWSNPADITYGTALSGTQLNAFASVAGNLVYTPASSAVLNAGTNTLSVTFTPTDSANYAGTNASVSIVVNKATPVLTWNNPADINYGTALGGSQLNASANVAGTFTYNPTNGTILSVGNSQTLSVDFTPNDSTNYNTTSTNVSINVLKSAPTITWSNPANIVYGTVLSTNQLNATANVAGSFAYSPDLGTLLNAGTNQTLSVTFTPTDTASYNSTSTNVSITVLKATPTISWSNPSDIIYGTVLSGTQLNATGSVSGPLTYTPTTGTVLNAGNNQSLSVTLTPTDTTNYNTTSTNVLINVLKASVSITWNNPADINYGTALSATQLNANASTAGTFVYSPVAGTVLSAGSNQTLSVTFTPSSANYSNATASVSINVSKVPLTVKANDATRQVGQANPAFSATYTGFVNGDTSASLSSPTIFATIADTNSPIGFYDIVPSGATSGNYNITFANGTLTVSPASTIVSTATGGNWSATGTWVGGVVPGASDNVAIAVGATVTVDTAASCFSLTLSNSATAGSTVVVSTTRSLSVGGGSGSIVLGQNLAAVSTASTTLLNVAGTLQAGNVTLTARRVSNKNADAILRLSNASAVATITNNISQDRNVASGGLLSQVDFTAAGALKLGGAFVTVGSGGTLSAGTGTVEYNAAGNQTVSSFTYNNLTLSGSGTKTGSAAVTIGATGTLLLKDTAVYGGVTPTYNAGSTLFYARTGAQVTGTALPAVPPANWNLSVSNASGITLRQSATVTGTLRLFAGSITTTPTNTLTADGTVIRTAGYVIGNLRKNFIVGSNVAQTFEVGVGSSYTPVSITFSNVATAAHVTVVANAGKHSAIATSTLNPAKGVNVNWTATPDVGLVANAYNVVFNFNASDLDAGANTSVFAVGDYTSGTWTYPAVANRTATSIEADGLTSFSDFQVAETTSVTVPTITWSNPADIVYGAALSTNELNATANVPGTFVYNPTLGTVLAAGNAQTLAVTFTPDDLSSYSATSTNVSINVLKATPSITWNNPAPIAYGTALTTNELNATASVPGTFNYTPAVGTVLNVGTNTLNVSFLPADSANYNGTSANVSIVVAAPSTSITWSDPADIVYGTALSTNELNATANVAGTFTYTPTLGTVLASGTNTLNVSFVPDNTNYNNASANVSLVVTKRGLSVVANDTSRQYGLTNPVFTGVISGALGGDNISATYASAATVGSNLGTYPIVPSLVDPNSKLTNYITSSTNGTLTITAAPLSVVVSNKTKVYGTANPTFTGSISGIRNGDNITASYSCSATTTSTVGNYTITASLNDPDSRLGNYLLATTNGTLTITKDTPSVVVASSLNPAGVGAAVMFTATISTPNIAVTNGFVQFWIDGTNYVTSPVSTNGLSRGTIHFATLNGHSVEAIYLGDANRNLSASPILTQTTTPLPQDVLACIKKLNGTMVIRFVGDGVSSYSVQRSTDLINWVALGTPTVGADGLLEITDVNAPTQPFRYYRTVKN